MRATEIKPGTRPIPVSQVISQAVSLTAYFKCFLRIFLASFDFKDLPRQEFVFSSCTISKNKLMCGFALKSITIQICDKGLWVR